MFSVESTRTMFAFRSTRSATTKRLFRVGALVVLVAMVAAAGRAESGSEREYVIKAGFLYNFFSYVDWPPGIQEADPSVFVIGVVGENPFQSAEEKLKNTRVKGRRIEFREIKDLSRLSDFHLIFIRSSEQNRMREILERTKGTPTLTVGENSAFINEGGVINIVPARNRFQIEINPTAAERAGLTISAQLLKLAQIVRS